MRLYNIDEKLYSDIISSKLNEAYFINQENNINIPNSHKKKGWKYFVDGFRLCKNSVNYTGSFSYDRGAHDKHKIKPLSFVSFTDNAGNDFLDFINSIINGDEKIFLQFKGLEVFDLRRKLFEIENIEIRNTVVDSLLISTINRYFPCLKKINFIKSIIKQECNFDKIKGCLEFNGSIIENIRVFNDTHADIVLWRTEVNKVSNTTINSKELQFNCITNINIKELFLKCNFPYLENLIVSPAVDMQVREFSYEDNFIYLPSSAPYLENLSIEGKLSSFDFLTDMKNLLRCNIKSIYDFHGSNYPDTSKSSERKKIKKRNIKGYQISKILSPDQEDKYILGKLELDRVRRLAQFNKLLSYSEDEKQQLLTGINPIEYCINSNVNNGEITEFYELYFDYLYFRNTMNEKDVRIGLEETYRMLNGYIHVYKNREVFNDMKKILICKNYIHNYDGKPILFKSKQRKVSTIKDALKFREKYEYRKGWTYKDLEEDNYHCFLECLNGIRDDEQDIDIGMLIDSSEVTNYDVTVNSFKDLGEGGRYIAGIIEKFDRIRNKSLDLKRKHDYYRSLIDELIEQNYAKFTIKEKIFLHLNNKKYQFGFNKWAKEIDVYHLKLDYDEDCLKEINMKTNGLYSKYFNMLKLTYTQYDMTENPYYLPVEKEHIKKLEF